MDNLCRLTRCAVVGLFRSLLRRKSPRVAFSNVDRLVFTGLYRLAPAVLDALKILKPETLIRWHRAGFRACWRWKSRPRAGRPSTAAEIRQLIREMSVANPLRGAPRIHGELLKLGIDVGQTCPYRKPETADGQGRIIDHRDGRSLEVDLVRRGRILSAAGRVASRNSCPATPA
jgi:hypothetical protein